MTTLLLKLYLPTAIVFFALDLLWLGVVAKGFYRREMGDLLAPEVRWIPALAFYAIYLAALLVLAVLPAVERGSLPRALALGALFGLAAYAAYDLTSLALIRGFPTRVVLVDLVWGTVLSATVSGAAYAMAGWMR